MFPSLLSARQSRPLLSALGVLTAGLLVLSSCSSGDSSEASPSSVADAVTGENAASQPPGLSPAALIVDDTVTPEGFVYDPPETEGGEELGELLDGEDAESERSAAQGFSPPQCAGLAVDSSGILEWMLRSPQTTTIANYFRVDNDEEGIFVMVTTDAADQGSYPADLAECVTFSRTITSGLGQMEKTFEVVPGDISVEGVEVLASARVTPVSIRLDGQDVDAGAVGVGLHILTATVRDVTFTVAALEQIPTEIVSGIAEAQAQRIINA